MPIKQAAFDRGTGRDLVSRVHEGVDEANLFPVDAYPHSKRWHKAKIRGLIKGKEGQHGSCPYTLIATTSNNGQQNEQHQNQCKIVIKKSHRYHPYARLRRNLKLKLCDFANDVRANLQGVENLGRWHAVQTMLIT